MSEQSTNPFAPFFDEVRKIVAEEIAKALSKKEPAKLRFTKEEAAKILNVKPSWLASRVRAGVVPHQRYENSHRIYFTQQDIDEIVNRSAKNGKV